MSFRYGIAVVPEAAFTAPVYQARQIICGQYASWAAEMFPVHLPLVDFFQCPEDAVESVAAGLGRVAKVPRGFSLRPYAAPVVALPGVVGTICLDYANPNEQRPDRALRPLHQAAIQVLQEVYGVAPNLRGVGENFRPYIPLMQEARLPLPVFEVAVEFARGVVQDVLREGSGLRMWHSGGQLILMRLESNAADAVADGWEQGYWAKDLRWNLLASYQL